MDITEPINFVKGTCPSCGEFETLTVNVWAGGGTWEARCPSCGGLVAETAPGSLVNALLGQGARWITGPLELTPAGDWDAALEELRP